MKHSGFTLIEVLVALAIAAVGLAAALSVVTNSSRNAVYLHDKTFATWIGLNHLTEVRFSGTMPSVDRTDGVSFEFPEWRFNLRTSNTEPLLRLNVEARGSTSLMQAKTGELLGLLKAQGAVAADH